MAHEIRRHNLHFVDAVRMSKLVDLQRRGARRELTLIDAAIGVGCDLVDRPLDRRRLREQTARRAHDGDDGIRRVGYPIGGDRLRSIASRIDANDVKRMLAIGEAAERIPPRRTVHWHPDVQGATERGKRFIRTHFESDPSAANATIGMVAEAQGRTDGVDCEASLEHRRFDVSDFIRGTNSKKVGTLSKPGKVRRRGALFESSLIQAAFIGSAWIIRAECEVGCRGGDQARRTAHQLRLRRGQVGGECGGGACALLVADGVLCDDGEVVGALGKAGEGQRRCAVLGSLGVEGAAVGRVGVVGGRRRSGRSIRSWSSGPR